MTDKELRKLKRAQLLEILFYLQKELDSLKQENEELKQRLEVNKEIPEEFVQQIGQIVRNTVKECLGSENNTKQVEAELNGENNGATE